MTRPLATCCCIAMLFASSLPAQTADVTMNNFINAAMNLTSQLRHIVDADSAQRMATDLVQPINTLNPLTAQVKALYGVQANQAAIQNLGPKVTDAQNQLQQELTRLLTGNCSLEGTVKSVGGGANVAVSFANRTGETVSMFWIDFNGNRSPAGTFKPGESWTATANNTYVNHYFLAANSAGVCIGLYKVTGAGTLLFTGLLRPTLDPYLALITN